ncbi:hypothetical protein Nepgr_015490 [Nepenthes gracilis]|uniref:Uncharacterized protein n=1 Tax=Nepenthes gracilis TaxID=150966 RepID=A0AAD3XR58_NEPGR|nr:hypothetical protein Nepgr_015490 [Nepenthes gracilis]
MSVGKVDSEVGVPFKWEKRPGISKVTAEENHHKRHQKTDLIAALPSPACGQLEKGTRVAAAAAGSGLLLPLPPCIFQPPLSSYSGSRGFGKPEKDPFLAAYRECTKSTATKRVVLGGGENLGFRIGVRKWLLGLSCKNSHNVRADAHVAVRSRFIN